MQSYAGATLLNSVPAELTDQLRQLANANHCSLFMALLAAFNILLSRYTGEQDIVVGTPIAGRQRRDVHESRWTTGSQRFPLARAFLEETARTLGGELSRAKLVCLPPGNRVYPHVDRGEYYRARDRFHLVLRSSGSWMRAGDEEVRMRAGELWWFDNDQEHEACNDGDTDRIHLIFDLLPLRPEAAFGSAGKRVGAISSPADRPEPCATAP